MRRLAALVVVACAAAIVTIGLAAAQGDAQDEAKAIIGKAIKAMGYENKAVPKGMRMKAKGTVDANGMSLEIVQNLTIRMPNQFKDVTEVNVNGMTISVTTIFDGKEAWIDFNGMVKDLGEKMVEEFKNVAGMVEASHLTPLLDKKFKLSIVGEAKVEGQPAVGIRISGKGFKDFNMYIDKKTNLIAKIERQAVDPMTEMEVQEERIFKSYRDMDGRKVPKNVSVNRDGNKFVEAEVLEYNFVDQIDPGEFAKPKK